jgi:hypothetical protein
MIVTVMVEFFEANYRWPTVRELALIVGKSTETVQRMRIKAVEEGNLETDGYGHYWPVFHACRTCGGGVFFKERSA